MNKLHVILPKLSSEELKQGNSLAKEVFARVEELKVLTNGYALRFPETQDLFEKLSYIIMINRACCPFLKQVLMAEPNKGAIWFELSGENGVKEFLANDLSAFLSKEFLSALAI